MVLDPLSTVRVYVIDALNGTSAFRNQVRWGSIVTGSGAHHLFQSQQE